MNLVASGLLTLFLLGSWIALVVAREQLREISSISSENGAVDVHLSLDVHEHSLDGGITFRTRAYNDQVPAPTIRISPGDIMNIHIHNNLKETKRFRRRAEWCTPINCTDLHGSQFRSANTTNLHTHGLHVSSAITADNVLDVTILPGESHSETIEIPADHMAGLFWYHPHWEGSSAIQVTGGAAGAIVIEDPKDSIPNYLEEAETRLLVLQQIATAELAGISGYAGDTTFHVDDAKGLPANWKDQVKENNQHGTGDIKEGGFNSSMISNIALVNGQLNPEISMSSGKWQRWQILNAGALFFSELTLSNSTGSQDACEIRLLAVDGIFLHEAPREVFHIVLTPAGRADVLIRCATPGTYTLASGRKPGLSGEWNSDLLWSPVVATIEVKGPAVPKAALKPPAAFSVKRPYYLKDLRSFPSQQTVPFNFTFQDIPVVDNASSPNAVPLFPHNGDESGTCTFNGLTWQKGKPLLDIKLDSVQEWNVQGIQAHPLHVHINPMQIQSFSQDGEETGTDCDIEYGYFCVGDWVDTLQIPHSSSTMGAVVRYRVADFTGEEVIHCHYLVHEDQGCLTYANITA